MKNLKTQNKKKQFKPGDRGFIRLSREIANGMMSPHQETRQYNRTVACLLILATPKQCTVEFRKIKYICQPGDLITTHPLLSECADVDPNFLRRVLEKLEKEQVIEKKAIHRGIYIKIPHYEDYTKKFAPIGNVNYSPIPKQLTSREQYEKEEFERNLALLKEMEANQQYNNY